MASTALAGFTKLGPGVYIRAGREAAQIPSSQPAAIALFSWMNAAPQHARKYADAYLKTYPDSSLLLIMSSAAIFTGSKQAQNDSLQPAVRYLKDSGLLRQKDSRLLVHIMSNGGGIRAAGVARLLRAEQKPAPRELSRDAPPRPPNEPALPARAYIFDSAPAKPTLGSFLVAFTAHLRGWGLAKLAYYIVLPIFHVFDRIWYNLIVRKPNIPNQMRLDLLDPSLFDQQAPKAFIYSLADEVAEAQAIDEHIAEAKLLGGPVDALRLKRSAHVSHMREDPEAYFSTIKNAYERGGSA